ncbi:B12-binding domain-containing radical SAM protein [bacterium]|nr:B12-binding domain-containing radical SAM protein [bacterium]
MDVILYFSKIHEKPLWFRIPLGLLSLAAVLHNRGVNVSVIDGNFEKDVWAKIDSAAPKDRKFIFGVSSMTGYQIKDGMEISSYIREKYRDAVIVWGGWHSTLLPGDTLKSELMDMIVIGPGEETIVDLVDAVEKGGGFEGILGIGYKENGKVIINGPRQLPDVNKLPTLKWDLIDVESYLMHDVSPRTITYISSRGCPYRCGFCAIKTIYMRKWKPLANEHVIEEIKYLKEKYGIDGIRFEDSNFFSSRNRVLQLSEEFIKNDFRLKWSALARPDDLSRYTRDELMLMKRGGMSQVLVGAESADQDALDLIKKDTKVEVLDKLVELCIANDISMILSYMVGFPKTGGKDIDITLNKIADLHSKFPFGEKNNEILLFYYTPYPGSDLYQMAIDKGFKAPDALQEWADLTLNELHAPWITPAQDRKIQKAMKTYGIIKFYIRAAEMLGNVDSTMKLTIKNFIVKMAVKLVAAFYRFRIRNKFYFFPMSRYIFYTFSRIPIFEFLRKLKG